MIHCALLPLILITGDVSSAKDNASPLQLNRAVTRKAHQKPYLLLNQVLIDSSTAISYPSLTQPLIIEPGRHRLDFDFSCSGKITPELTQLRCRLEGNEVHWITTTNGMVLICQVRDEKNEVIAEVRFNAVYTSEGWSDDLANSKFTSRSEPFYIPKEGRALYMEMSSGSCDVTGVFAIQNLQVTLPGTLLPTLWSNSSFAIGKDLSSPEGTPHRWSRLGLDNNIASLTQTSAGLALAHLDHSQQQKGVWASRQAFDANTFGGHTVIISWQEAYNVIGGSIHRASYFNVPPGEYTFQAIGMTSDGASTASLALPIYITPPLWERTWFLATVTICGVALLALAIIIDARRRAQRRLQELRFQNDLERDRARIARDMHDDLGTRISVLNLNGSMALRYLEKNPKNARRLLELMNSSSREIVVAMDSLVWAVNPDYDNLDQFASHLTRMAEEIFRESPIRCRLNIPTQLPPQPLESDFRYQLALAIKEALHNILRHAGKCEVTLSLKLEKTNLHIQIKDNGRGFELEPESPRHGISNLKQRLKDLGGTCSITSVCREGTTIDFTCPLSKHTNARTP